MSTSERAQAANAAERDVRFPMEAFDRVGPYCVKCPVSAAKSRHRECFKLSGSKRSPKVELTAIEALK